MNPVDHVRFALHLYYIFVEQYLTRILSTASRWW
jgi:hypothetical protein